MGEPRAQRRRSKRRNSPAAAGAGGNGGVRGSWRATGESFISLDIPMFLLNFWNMLSRAAGAAFKSRFAGKWVRSGGRDSRAAGLTCSAELARASASTPAERTDVPVRSSDVSAVARPEPAIRTHPASDTRQPTSLRGRPMLSGRSISGASDVCPCALGSRDRNAARPASASGSAPGTGAGWTAASRDAACPISTG
jgi:hypothetical protein